MWHDSSVFRSQLIKNDVFYFYQKEYRNRINFKPRSPVVAGVLSSIVQGLGKVYLGKKREGIRALIPVLLLGGQAWEAYRVQKNIKNPRFIFFSITKYKISSTCWIAIKRFNH